MELTAAAAFLNTAFAGYDHFILSILSKIQCGFLTFLFKLITLIGEKGIVFFLAAIVFMLFPKTRRLGVCLFGSVACGALITNIILKDLIARPRPFFTEPYMTWWRQIGAPAEDEFSFPSGHATAAAAGMVALRLMKGKKWTVPAIVWVVVTMIARNYLMAHYPSDVLFGALIGTASAFIARGITVLIFRFLETNRRKALPHLALTWSLPDYAGIPSRLGLTSENSASHRAFEESRRNGESRNAQNGQRHSHKNIAGRFVGRIAGGPAAKAENFAATPDQPRSRHENETETAAAGRHSSPAPGSGSAARATAGYRGKHEK